eukprot:PITA_25049
MYIFQQKLKIIKANIKCYNMNTFGNIFQAKMELEEKMAGLQQTMIKEGPNEEREKIGSELNSYFNSLLIDHNHDRTQAINKVVDSIPPVTEEKKSLPLRDFTEQEIKEVVFTMATNKAPKSDSFTIEFFKSCWPIIKADLFNLIKNFHRTKRVLSTINATFLTLIPKSDHTDSPDKFRPIALCNVLYKILSKLMANRLKPILP